MPDPNTQPAGWSWLRGRYGGSPGTPATPGAPGTTPGTGTASTPAGPAPTTPGGGGGFGGGGGGSPFSLGDLAGVFGKIPQFGELANNPQLKDLWQKVQDRYGSMTGGTPNPTPTPTPSQPGPGWPGGNNLRQYLGQGYTRTNPPPGGWPTAPNPKPDWGGNIQDLIRQRTGRNITLSDPAYRQRFASMLDQGGQ